MDRDGDSPPFWPPPPPSSTVFYSRRRGSPMLSSAALIIVLPVLALILVFFAVPSFLNFTSQFMRPNAVKKSWDSINVLLVLFAILCGVLARKNDEKNDENRGATGSVVVEKSNESISHSLFEFSDRKIYDPPIQSGSGRLRRSSSSYPDLRQESLWGVGDDRRRFHDDFEVNKYRSQASSENVYSRPWTELERDDFDVKVIPVDTFVLRSSPPPAPPPPPPPMVQRKPRRTFESVAQKDKLSNNDANQFKKSRSPPPPPPPPPRRVPVGLRPEKKSGKSERKRGGATKDIATVFVSLINQTKKKKKKQKTKNIHDHAVNSPPSPETPAPPPPPPPPPPPSVFHNLFRKGSKSKRIYSVSAPPPPPPPPPRPPPPRPSKRKTHIPSAPPPPPPRPDTFRRHAAGRPPLPARTSAFYDKDDNVNSGGQSPLIPMPPPPPPFRMPEQKFVVRGDFVRIRSTHSSRCSSPELDGVHLSSNKTAMDGGDAIGSTFCPSPDVNIKADTFIARLRDEWRLEKINSLREKTNVGLGPDLGPIPNPTPN